MAAMRHVGFLTAEAGKAVKGLFLHHQANFCEDRSS